MKNGICEIDSYERIAQEYHAYSKMLNPPFPDDGFWDMVRIAESGCWIWIGGPTTGYGRVWKNKKRMLAHRYVYMLLSLIHI